MVTLTIAFNQSTSVYPSTFTLDQFHFNDTAIYRTLEANYQQDLSPYAEGDQYLTEKGEFNISNMGDGKVVKRLVVNGHDLEHANQPNLYDAILVQSVPGTELSVNDTSHGRLTLAFQRELKNGEIPIQISKLKIKFSILPNIQSQRSDKWLLVEQINEPYDAWLHFYANSNDDLPSEFYGFRSRDSYAEFSFPQNAPIAFIFSAFNGAFVVVNEVIIEF